MSVRVAADPKWVPLLAFVTSRTGLAFGAPRVETAEARIAAAMARAGLTDPGKFVAHLSADSLALDDLVAELTIGETYFFREPAVFDYLRREFLPRIGRERGSAHVLRVWSAGCASGEEAYSLAIMLEEEGWGGRSIVLGTDVSRASLVKARRATYGPWAFRGTDESFVRRHFTQEGGRFTLKTAIRERVQFEYHNLALDAYPPLASGICGLDLILCRNVLIYFDRPVIGRVAGRLQASLAEGGLLVMGAADPPLQELARLDVVRSDAGIMYRGMGNEPVRPAHVHASAGSRKTREAGGKAHRGMEPGPATVPAPAPVPGRDDESAFAERVRALANAAGPLAAAEEAGRGMLRYPLSVDLAFLRAVLLAGDGRHGEAAAAARNALYLDSTQPAVHFVLAASLWNGGDLDGARRAFRNARDLAAALPATEAVAFAGGETAGRVAAGSAAHLAMLELEGGGRS